MVSHERWVLVTGACGGIGRALVETFLVEGYQVIGTDQHKPEAANTLATEYLQLNLEKISQSTEYGLAACKKILELTGDHGLSALINNAAIQSLTSLEELSRESWQQTMAVNLTAPLFLIQGLADSLEQNNGSVVNISSIHARQTKPGFFAYATSKAALSALTQNLAVTFGARVRINAIEPAAVGTEMLQAGFIGHEEAFARLEAYHPLGRIADPAEVAELAVFLCSDKARFIHGECISQSGGIDRRLHDPG